jgi:cyclopropane fatty-acyl-phospholipid synthase-like methyltransferase
MQSHTGGVQRLYTEELNAYRRFISFFRSRDAIRALLESSGLLGPKLRVLDAGAGFGTATFALLDALHHRGKEAEAIEAFDLTPAMLARFQAELDSRGITQVRLKQANVLELDQQLPSSWSNYNLIVSTSMLEYVARPHLSQALSALGARLARHGTLLVVITRKNWITRVLIEWWWQAARYSRDELREAFAAAGFRNLVFRRFPFRYCWHSLSNHVVMATRGETAQDIAGAGQIDWVCRLRSRSLTPMFRFPSDSSRWPDSLRVLGRSVRSRTFANHDGEFEWAIIPPPPSEPFREGLDNTVLGVLYQL